MTLTIDTASEGLAMVLKDYQEEALRFIWENKGVGTSSREVWNQVNKVLKNRTISRASIINFLKTNIPPRKVLSLTP